MHRKTKTPRSASSTERVHTLFLRRILSPVPLAISVTTVAVGAGAGFDVRVASPGTHSASTAGAREQQGERRESHPLLRRVKGTAIAADSVEQLAKPEIY